MRSCVVPFCKNKGRGENVSYFRITQKRFEVWMRALNRNPQERISPDSCVCSNHFKPADFVDGKFGERHLKEHAVPSVKLRPDRHLFGPKILSKIPLKKEYATDVDNPGCNTRNDNNACEQRIPLPDSDTSEDVKSDDNSETETSNVSDLDMKRKVQPSDSEGLQGSAEKRRLVARLMHNYCKSPRKMNEALNSLSIENKELKMVIKKQKAQISRLKKNVTHLKVVVKELKQLRLISGS